MTIHDAAEMLDKKGNGLIGETWADLGCGSGTFTLALASILPANSVIYAVDEQRYPLGAIPGQHNEVFIKPVLADFVKDVLPFEKVDGILMANALHYVKDKAHFLTKIKAYLNTGGCLLVVEYATDKPVAHWVPYPASFQSLQKLLTQAGLGMATKLHSRPSAFGGEMYSAIVYL